MAGAVFDAEGRVLLVKQTYMPGWRLPGGGVGWGEPPELAVLREMTEEVGLSGGTASLFGLYTARAGIATHLVALYRITGGQIAFRPNWEVREIRFADPAAAAARGHRSGHKAAAGGTRRIGETIAVLVNFAAALAFCDGRD